MKLNFAQKVFRKLSEKFLEVDLGFYFHRSGFTHKMNHFNQVRASRSMTWRKLDQRFDSDLTEKGIQKDTEGNVGHFMVAI